MFPYDDSEYSIFGRSTTEVMSSSSRVDSGSLMLAVGLITGNANFEVSTRLLARRTAEEL